MPEIIFHLPLSLTQTVEFHIYLILIFPCNINKFTVMETFD